jgi:hypothetical protein
MSFSFNSLHHAAMLRKHVNVDRLFIQPKDCDFQEIMT